MKLEQFKQSNKRKKVIIIASVIALILVSAIVLIRTYAIFETKHAYDVIKGRVSNYEVSDIIVTSFLDGTPSKTFPLKDSQYGVDKIECNNGAKGLWNYTNWYINIENLTSTRTKCSVHFVTLYKEEILNETDPKLSENLVPIVILDDGSIKKADITKQWYSYENKVWANAVILQDESKVYQNDEVIPESNIESYFVYIPRYKYKLFHDGIYGGSVTPYEEKSQEIEVVFENKNTDVSSGSTVNSWLTHPAFTNFNTNGIWIGKFETGYKDAATPLNAQQNVMNVSKIVVKPNVYSWRSIQISNAHLNSFNYQRGLDSHLMKNTDWGAVSYLSHSKYGTMSRVRVNNNSSYLTGFGAVREPTGNNQISNTSCITNPNKCNETGVDPSVTLPWNTTLGYLASSTGNISGVYDMAGGNWEMTLSVIYDVTTKIPYIGNALDNSGFMGIYGDTGNLATTGIEFPTSKYVDYYPSDKYSSILGDATMEFQPFFPENYNLLTSWYRNQAFPMNTEHSFGAVGGSFFYGVGAGPFASASFRGPAYEDYGYRISLSI